MSMTASAFWKWFDDVSDKATAAPDNAAIVAAGFEPYHSGGGIMLWRKELPRGFDIVFSTDEDGAEDELPLHSPSDQWIAELSDPERDFDPRHLTIKGSQLHPKARILKWARRVSRVLERGQA